MKESGIAVGGVPSAEFADKTKKDSTGDEEEKRNRRQLFRNELSSAIKLDDGKLRKGSRLIYSGGAKPPDKSRRDFINNLDPYAEIAIRVQRMKKN